MSVTSKLIEEPFVLGRDKVDLTCWHDSVSCTLDCFWVPMSLLVLPVALVQTKVALECNRRFKIIRKKIVFKIVFKIIMKRFVWTGSSRHEVYFGCEGIGEATWISHKPNLLQRKKKKKEKEAVQHILFCSVDSATGSFAVAIVVYIFYIY